MAEPERLSDKELIARYYEGLEKERLEKLEANAGLIDAFIKHCASKGIELKPSDFNYVQTTGIIAKSPGLLMRLIGDIPAERDGFLPFKTLLQRFSLEGCQEGYLNCGNFLVMAHPYFRRGFGEINNFAPRFIEKFWEFPTEAVESYIALGKH